jgi:hypothetical protein
MSLSTPVVFIIFNRPDLTGIVFKAISQARPKKLLIIADGPRFSEEVGKCEEARSIIDKVDWDCEVLTNFSETNLGCKKRVSSGLDWAFSEVEEAIILEDDCLPHRSFFKFCETLLDKYRDDEQVMMISGDNFLIDGPKGEDSYFFSRYFAIWGWASWRKAWKKYDIGMKDWGIFKCQKQLDLFYTQEYMRRYITSMFDGAYKNEIDTWDTQWFYSCLFNNGLCIVPQVNLVSNIGITGTHSSSVGRNQNLPVFFLDCENLKHPILIFQNHLYDDQFFEGNFKPRKKTFITKIGIKAGSILSFLRRRDKWL